MPSLTTLKLTKSLSSAVAFAPPFLFPTIYNRFVFKTQWSLRELYYVGYKAPPLYSILVYV